MSKTQKLSKHIPLMAQQGMEHVVGSPVIGVGMQAFKVTLGGTPHSVSFAALGLKNMADTSYVVQVEGESVARLLVDESTIATSGFDILGGAAAEVAHVVVIGRIKGMMSPTGVI